MTSLGQQLREYFEAVGPPLDIEEIVADLDKTAARRHRGRMIATAAAAVTVLGLGLVAYLLMLPERSSIPVVDDSPAPDDGPNTTEATETRIDEPVPGIGSIEAVTDEDLQPGAVPSPSSSLSSSQRANDAPTASESGGDAATALRGRILYESRDVIRIVKAGGGESRNLAAGSFPRWSPNGTRLSFRDDAGLWTIWADGTGRTQVAGSDVEVDGAPFSPDGARLLYTAGLYDCGSDLPVPPFGCAPSSDAGIWSVGADGTSPRRLVTGVARHPVWGPNGTRIAYIRDGGLYVAGSDGSNERLVYQPQVEDEAGRPQFSPDGTRLAFYVTLDSASGPRASDSCGPRMELWTAHTDGSSAGPLSRGPYRPGTAGTNYVRAPQWSPDGAMITFADILDVWVVNVADGDARQVARTVSEDCLSGTADADPTWSPDGQFIVAHMSPPGPSAKGLYAIRPDGSEPHPLVGGMSRMPTWRP